MKMKIHTSCRVLTWTTLMGLQSMSRISSMSDWCFVYFSVLLLASRLSISLRGGWAVMERGRALGD